VHSTFLALAPACRCRYLVAQSSRWTCTFALLALDEQRVLLRVIVSLGRYKLKNVEEITEKTVTLCHCFVRHFVTVVSLGRYKLKNIEEITRKQ